MDTRLGEKRMRMQQHDLHRRCIVCGSENPEGLQLPFAVQADGSVEARFACGRRYEGYPLLLHGGVVAAALDGAMTNCLFAHGIEALTAELTVRYHRPVAVGRPAVIRGWLERSAHGCHLLAAEFRQDGRVAATGRAKFLECPRRPAAGAPAIP